MRTKRGVLLTAALLSQTWRACANLTYHGFAPDHAPATKRDDIGGLLGGLGGQEPHRTEQVSATNVHTESAQPTHPASSNPPSSDPPSSTPATPGQTSRQAETASKATQQEHTEEKEKTTNSITGTPPPTSTAPSTPSHTNIFVSNSVIPYPTGPAVTGLPEKDKGPATDWRVIGVAVIAVSVIATAILSVIFFDQWMRFVRDLCGGRRKKHKLGGEELVPDWKRGSWDIKSAREDKIAEPEVLIGQNMAGVGRDRMPGAHVAAREALNIPARPFFRPASNPFEAREVAYPAGFAGQGSRIESSPHKLAPVEYK
ncbi:hypothetical protein EWM64_g3351 [Hericium alpestre]|uniref:Uncharacterized protein n=1 Tax=Hericium alpestre TaxID=135208 RepID=A0A4Z0A2X5_9AGAM|nr:hypothetical protein EWM64_g3351 [Hericium alpestre]